MQPTRRRIALGLTALLGLSVAGCATLRQIAALRDVAFALDRVSEVRLAGIELDRVRSAGDLGIQDAARLAQAMSSRDLPLELRVHVQAENPADNHTEARLTRMSWTLLLEDRETVSGVLDEDVLLPPGEPQDIPVGVSLNLVEFFEGSGQDLLELGLALAGQGGASKTVALRIHPVVDTPLGPIRYPQPITISQEVGG